MLFSIRPFRRFTVCWAQLISHDWLRGCTRCVYLILILISAGCIDRHTSNQTPISSPECLSEQTKASCFYRKAPFAKRNSKLIIFAHGVFSTVASTWGDVESGNSWPALLKGDEQFESFDIYLMTYPSSCLTYGPSVHETANNELERLKIQGVFEQYKEIYFITHSMGGLVVKSLLTRLKHGEEEALLRQVRAVIFLGTPAQGVNIATLGKMVCLNPQVGDMKLAHLNLWLPVLEDSWTLLMEGRERVTLP